MSFQVHIVSFQLPASSFQPAFSPPCPALSTVGFGLTLAVVCDMTMSNHLVRWGGARLSRRLGRSLPWIGAAVGLLTIASTMKRKGVVGGVLDAGLNAVPFVGAAKNVAELARGRDFFPDRRRG
jgi:hypothetical protein